MTEISRSVIVTAGANGIGAAIAAAFADSGAAVHIVDIDADAVERFSGSHADIECTTADAADEDSVSRTIDAHIDRFGGVDVMINCAGTAGPTAFVEEISLRDWRRCLAVNLDAAFLFSRKVIPYMKSAGSGNIVNISSTAGWHGYPLRSPYCAAKWAVIGFTKSLAMEAGRYGIRANAICPGSISGERMNRVIAAEAQRKQADEKEIRNSYINSCSMRTFIAPQDIADMALFLCSDKAGRVTGQIVNVDGHLESYGGLET